MYKHIYHMVISLELPEGLNSHSSREWVVGPQVKEPRKHTNINLTFAGPTLGSLYGFYISKERLPTANDFIVPLLYISQLLLECLPL